MRPLALATLSALALAGCGTSADRDQARATTQRFFAAVARHDGATACRQLTADAAQQLADQEGKPCPQAVTGLQLKPGSIVRLEVFVTNAKADLSSRESAFLSRSPSGWKLSSVGCAHDDKPADHPFNCQLES